MIIGLYGIIDKVFKRLQGHLSRDQNMADVKTDPALLQLAGQAEAVVCGIVSRTAYLTGIPERIFGKDPK